MKNETCENFLKIYRYVVFSETCWLVGWLAGLVGLVGWLAGWFVTLVG